MGYVIGRASLVALALVWCAGEARASNAPAAAALARAGREARDRGDTKVACERFHESYRLDATPDTLLDIAACQEALHRLADAWESYQHVAESLLPDDPRLAAVKERIAALDARLPRLTLEAACSNPPLEVLRDGVPLSSGAFGVPLPMDPGEHRIVVRAAGRQTREYVALLTEGEQMSLHVEPGDMLPPEPEPPRQVAAPIMREPVPPPVHGSEGWRGLRTAGYVSGGVGLAGFIAAGMFTAFAMGESRSVEQHCLGRLCDAEGLKASERGEQLLHLADVGLVVGVVGVAAGGVLLWRASREEIRLEHTVGGAGLSYARVFP
jgi:hypothetical protein